MNAVFLRLLNMSIAASWLIIAVIVLRLLLKRAPKWLPCTLWAIVAVRLICPFSFESSFSLIPSAETISPYTVQYAQRPEIDSGVTFINNTLNPVISESFAPAPAASVNPLYVWMYIASIVWVIGVICLLGYALVSFLRIRYKVREAMPLRDNIWICDAVNSPFILGLVRPRIYLSSSTDEEQMDYILVHEQAHLKRRDHWWKPLGYMLLAVYWFNPLVWAAYILLCRDIEIACDEKAIKDMDILQKKSYSNALVSCSVQRRMIVACPLAFGEVGVRERVKIVLNYRKPAFWVVMAAIAACVLVAVCFLTDPRNDTFDIKIVIPAGGEGPVYYSEEEISPNRNKITLSSGKGLGDTSVVLKPTEVSEENAYDEPAYMTPRLPIKMNAEKGGWFRIGVNMSNPTEEDIVVYVRVKGVEVRIADPAVSADVNTSDDTEPSSEESIPTSESDTPPDPEKIWDADTAIRAAILEKNIPSYESDYDFACSDFVTLATMSATPLAGDTTHTITYYGWALYQQCKITQAGIEDVRGTHIPVALTFDLNENGYTLKEYWEPRSGSYNIPDIRDKFPADVAEDGTDSQKFIMQQVQSCYKQAIQFSGLDTDAVIGNLLDTICSDPKASSDPQDYIDAHSIEYRELLFYGEYTLRYCFDRFDHGNETGLNGKIMAIVCEELLQTKGMGPADAGTAETGQFWYDTLLAHASNLIQPYLEYQGYWAQ
ncbi:MAG: transcriptional regulator [Acetatifactor sp.]|nr:transcriptional regulator [Acetatifactor sp.]